MYYLYLLKKNKNETQPFKVTTMVKEFSHFCDDKIKDYSIICFPGYFSKTDDTIKSFCQYFPNENKNRQIYFLKGMNGDIVLENSNLTIQEEHANRFKTIPLKGKKDHSKTLFFTYGEYKGDNNLKDYLLNNTFAILVGSSNLSYTTYYRDKADKGELDVFIVDAKLSKNTSQDIKESLLFNDSEALKLYNTVKYGPTDEVIDRLYSEGITSNISLSKQMDKTDFKQIVEQFVNFE